MKEKEKEKKSTGQYSCEHRFKNVQLKTDKQNTEYVKKDNLLLLKQFNSIDGTVVNNIQVNK